MSKDIDKYKLDKWGWIGIIVLCVLFLSSCAHSKRRSSSQEEAFIFRDSLFEIKQFQFVGNTLLDTVRYSNTFIQGIGEFAIDENDKLTDQKVGKWIDFYSDGSLMSVGTYDIASFVVCCLGGASREYYSYKKGEWSYFYPSGQLKAKGIYKKHYTISDNNCALGEKVIYHAINFSWNFYDIEGEKEVFQKRHMDCYEDVSDAIRFASSR